LVAASSPALPALGLAPLQDSSGLARRIRPASPSIQIQRANPGPRFTLPGPALTPALKSLQEAGISKVLVDRPRVAAKGSHGWLVGIGVAGLLLAGFLALDLYNAPTSAAEPKVTPPAATAPSSIASVSTPVPADPTAPVSPAVSPAVSKVASYSLAKAIEVTGFRFVGDKKPEVRYLVVNHSSAELENVTVYVTLRSSASKPGQAPLYRFAFRAPALGPFESKEMSAPPDKGADKALDKLAHSADWQSLHADIELGQ
jgi:hypothetical protein